MAYVSICKTYYAAGQLKIRSKTHLRLLNHLRTKPLPNNNESACYRQTIH